MSAPVEQEPSEPAKIRVWLVRHRTALVEGGWAVVLYVLLSGALLGYDGFGLSAAASTSDLIQQIFAREYDRDTERLDPVSRPVVVLVTDETLHHPAFESEASGWPPTFDLHAKVLSRILEEQPSLLFIDVLFRDKRGDEVALRNTLDGYASARPPIPVLVAAGAECPPEGDDREARLAEQMAAPFIGRTWPVAVPALPDGDDNALRQYQLWQTTDSAIADSHIACPTAALAMYWAIQHGLARAELGATKTLDSAHLRTMGERMPDGNPFLEPLEIIWGARRNPAGPGRRPAEESVADGGHDDEAKSECGAYLPATPVSAAFASLAGYDLRQQCPYLETIRAEDLMLATPGAMLRGRPVLYGLSFVGAEDVIFTPVHGRLPGVHQHAMALDNLLARDSSYLRRNPEILLGPIRFPSWVDLLLIGSGAVLFALWRWRRRRDQHEALVAVMATWGIPDCLLREGGIRVTQAAKKSALWVLALVLTILSGLIPVALVLAIGWVLFSSFNQAPINWAGHLGVFAGVVGVLELRERVARNYQILLRRDGPGAAGVPKGGF